ncbi:fungal-specific transcription factor domain-containing protein [Aspergillus karnatakaensis]|uniref:Zn(II)2Cys6 transcription factor n=1 Tax=Aspergillus karnatakaensis TaxID=1810916 RepID=UPI003CCD507B
MPKISRPAIGTPEFRACTECRIQCSGTSPCQYCSRTKKQCVFINVPPRTPLTRKNLDDAERRCARLEEALRRLNPALDAENILAGGETPADSCSEGAPDQSHNLNSIAESLAGSEGNDEFEWNEATSTRRRRGCADGMALLPTDKAKSGYLGTSSGSTLLRTITGSLPESTSLDAEERRFGLRTAAHELGSPSFAEHMNNTIVLDGLVDAYFRYYHPSYPILHERTFRRRYNTRRQNCPHTDWHPIFYLVLAIGEWLLGVDSGPEQSKHYNAARSRMSMRMLESGSLLTVQTFLLMGNNTQKRDRPNTGYNFVGIAYRMALGLGLHREPPPESTADTLLNEQRRVAWWSVYCFDSGFSLTTGRPIMASDSFIDTRLPRNIDDSECEMTSILPPPTNQPTIYSALIAQSKLAVIGNTIYRDVVSIHIQTGVGLRVARSLDHQLKAWKLSLPVYFTAHEIPTWFRGPRAIILWKEQNLRMLLWWGSQRLCSTSSESEEAANLCQYTAIEAIQEIATYCIDHPSTIHAGLAWYSIYFIFQAVIVLSIHQFKPQNSMELGLTGADQLWILSITKARETLAQLAQNNAAATRCLKVLDRIWQHSQTAQSTSPPVATLDVDSGQQSSGEACAVDPALQIFLRDSTWDNSIFEGLNGFPSTVEANPFDNLATSFFEPDPASG